VLEDLKVMVELQGVDQRIHELEKNRERLPRLIKIAGESLREAEGERDAAQARLDELYVLKRSVDGETGTEGEHLRKLKLRSTEIKTNKEYFAHLKEIEDCQKKISRLEESSLELMEKVEKAEAELGEKKNLLDEEQARFGASKTNIESSFASGDAELEELRARRRELMPKLSKESAEIYKDLLRSYPDSTVAEAKGGSCMGCRMILPPQVFNNVRKGESVVTCNNCRRILYFKG